MTASLIRINMTALLTLLLALTVLSPRASAQGRADQQSTELISRATDGGLPDGPSTNPSISNDRRWARLIAFESQATNLVPGDSNKLKDIFLVSRADPLNNQGLPWQIGDTTLISRGYNGSPADGPSWGAQLDGSFTATRGGREVVRPHCIAFLSAATNLVPGDSNKVTDAFISRSPGSPAERVSLPGNTQSNVETSQVAVSGDCSRVAFVTGGVLFVRYHTNTYRLGPGQDPSFAYGQTNQLVYGDAVGVRLAHNPNRPGRLVVHGGSNPSYNDVKCQVIAFQLENQVYYRNLKPNSQSGCQIGRGTHLAGHRGGEAGNGASFDPQIGNSGYYVLFNSTATNLGVNALGRSGDFNDAPDVYLYTAVRDITLVESVREKAVPAGGEHGQMSYYANYVVFDSPAQLGVSAGERQIFMRYLGPV
jgi:hypothetical protein